MKLKSLLLGSAVAAVAATGARAADAIIIAEPEPMEYVRICDVYGTGFFYIPGTQNCLRIGGYVRYQMNYSNESWTEVNGSLAAGFTATDHSYRFSKLARFAPTFDVRSETEWGTLRAFAEVEFDWYSYTWGNYNIGPISISPADVGLTTGAFGLGSSQTTNLNHAFIELIQASGTLRLGKGDLPYARFLNYGNNFGPFGGSYGFRNGGELSYTFDAGNGFSAIVAVVESNTGLFEPAVEAGVNFTQGWGSIGAIAAYDTPADEWSAKGVARLNFSPFTAALHVFYSSGVNAYTVGASEWSVMGVARVEASDTLGVAASVQWFDRHLADSVDRWQITGAVDWRPIAGLRIRPEVRYTTEVKTWEAAIRFDRSF